MDAADTRMKLFLLVQRQSGLSRRKAQELVEAGEVSVDGRSVNDPFLPVDPSALKGLTLRGHPLPLQAPQLLCYKFHKPQGMLCSHDDPHEGNTVGRVLRGEGFIGYSWAGRLDQDAEGLLLITNDGALLHQLSHPRYEVPKTYHVWLDRVPRRPALEEILRQMQRGIHDDGDRLRIHSGQVEGKPPHVKLQLNEGKKHEIKRLFAHFQLDVVRLVRVAVGPIQLGRLRCGALEKLPNADVDALHALAQKTPAGR